MKWSLAVLVCVLLLVPAATQARTWLVRQDGSGDCTTIQACIDSAGNGDTVLVGPGVYSEEVWIQDKSDFVLTTELGVSYTKLLGLFGESAIYCKNVTGESAIEEFTVAHSYASTGGAISCTGSSLTICGNVIFDCSASGIEGTDGAGGAIDVHLSSATIRGNTIYDCRVGTGGTGGGIYLSSSPDVTIEENIIAFCTGEAVHSYTDVPVILCNDVWGNTPTNYGGVIPDQTGLNGNISFDPLFCDTLSENFRLQPGSPCLDAPGCGLIGALGEGCPPIGVEEPTTFTTWGKIKVLFR